MVQKGDIKCLINVRIGSFDGEADDNSDLSRFAPGSFFSFFSGSSGACATISRRKSKLASL